MKTAYGLGFCRGFFLERAVLFEWKEAAKKRGVGEGLEYDMLSAYPDAGSILLLVWPYSPFCEEERISAYYLASNACYHAGNALVQAAAGAGIALARANIPLRAFALHNGIGTAGKNGLLSIPPYGTRIVLSAFSCPLEPAPFEPVVPDPCPRDCTACAAACPAGAIGDDLEVRRCMRYYMDGAQRPGWVMEAQRQHLGCEACQFACKKNAALMTSAPDEAARSAFELGRLLSGDCTAARGLFGRNMTSGGKLICEAVVFAARAGMYEAQIRALLQDSEFFAVKNTASWALEQYFKEK